MAKVVLSRDALGEIADHFGLKHVRHLSIDIPLNGIVTITAEMYPEIDGLEQLYAVLKKYQLAEIDDSGKGETMASSTASLPISDVTKNIMCEITLTGMKTFKARMSLGIILFKFAAWVVGMRGKITVGDQKLGEIVK